MSRVNALAERAKTGLRNAIQSTGIKACVTGGGSMFRLHFKEHPPQNYRQAYMTEEENQKLAVMLDHLFEQGLMMINTCSATISTAMGESEIDTLVEAVHGGLNKLA